jgi:two-component system, cell cycle sensor histidine kinase and response regulator CckA
MSSPITADLEQDHRRLLALPETMRAFAEATTDYQRLLGVVAEQMALLIGDGSFVALLSEDQSELQPVSVRFRDPATDEVARKFLAGGPIRVDGPSLGARVVRTRAGVLLPRVDLETLAGDVAPAHAALIRGLAITSFLVLPLEIHGRVLGFVSIARVGADARPFSANDEAIARNLSEHAALAISNAQLLEAVQRELTERKRAEESTERFVALIQASGEFIAMAGLDGRILFVNDGGRQLIGIDRDTDLGTLRLTDFHTDDGMKRAPIIRSTGRWQGQGQLRHFKTGELIDTQVSSFLVRDAAGQPVAYATVQHDMRETKLLEAQLRQAQKMEAIGTLAGGIAHDFNNILGAILGNLELARMEVGPGHAAQARFDEIASAGRRAVALVRQILTFGRQRETSKRVIRLEEVVTEAVALLRSTLSANVELVMSTAPDTPNVSADPTQVHQILLNLVTNAWHALDGNGGRITISLSGTTTNESAPSPPGAERPSRWARLEVSDNGHGMDAPTLERIFDPFFTTKEAGEGTGLGLSVVHGIVKDHVGTIRVDSTRGKGTTFEILLPGVDAEPERAPPTTTRLPDGRGRSVLYLDDEEPLVRMTEILLRRSGYRVQGFTRANEVFDALRRDASAFDLVITDQNMPGLSGLDVAKAVASIRPGLPVILTSGHVTRALHREATRVGVKHVIHKPSSVEDLCDAIDRFAASRSGS